MPIDHLLSVAEVARIFGVHIRTVHRWIRQGRLDAVQATTGRTSPWLVTRESVEAIESRRAA